MSAVVVLLAIAMCQVRGTGNWKCVIDRAGANNVKRAICDTYCHAEHGDELERCSARIDELRGG